MTFAQLRDELAARGFDHLSDTRLGQYVNWGRAALDDEEFWPYRESSATGSPPLAISDLGTIEVVTDTVANATIFPYPFRRLLDEFGDLSTTGNPIYYYLASPGGGSPEVATYPVGSTIGVQYWRTTPDLSADGDTPLAPSRFHRLIVDLAVQRAYMDKDNYASASQLQPFIDADLQTMRVALLLGQTQGPAEYVGAQGDDL